MTAGPVDGAAAVVEARPAATVMLLRDGPVGLQTWLLRRVAGMAFAPGMSVFPGGRVDPGDASPRFEWRAGTPEPGLRPVSVAAVRETFEEVGVLLTRPVAPLAVLRRRAEIEARSVDFAQLLHDAGLGLDGDLVRPWARWITPEVEPRRYDTWFFVAGLPDGASAEAATAEAVEAGWIAPAEALVEQAAGTRAMMPPTTVNLRALAQFDRVADVLAAAAERDLRPVRPVVDPARRTVTLPDGATLSME